MEFPLFLLYCIQSIGYMFRAYPVVGDYGYSLALFTMNAPLFLKLDRRMRIAAGLATFSAIFGSVMWFLWIYPGSGNANFYYNQTIIFILSNSFMVTESMTAVRRVDATNVIREQRKSRID
jgi:phosphatidylinositol glycan class U